MCPCPKTVSIFTFACNHVWMELSFHCVCFNIYHLLFFFSLQSSFSLQNLLVKTVHVALGGSLVYCCLWLSYFLLSCWLWHKASHYFLITLLKRNLIRELCSDSNPDSWSHCVYLFLNTDRKLRRQKRKELLYLVAVKEIDVWVAPPLLAWKVESANFDWVLHSILPLGKAKIHLLFFQLWVK